jgi:hypothetical protein
MARLTQDAVEVITVGGDPNVRVTQLAREVLTGSANPNVRVTQYVREVLCSVPPDIPPAWLVINEP